MRRATLPKTLHMEAHSSGQGTQGCIQLPSSRSKILPSNRGTVSWTLGSSIRDSQLTSLWTNEITSTISSSGKTLHWCHFQPMAQEYAWKLIHEAFDNSVLLKPFLSTKFYSIWIICFEVVSDYTLALFSGLE